MPIDFATAIKIVPHVTNIRKPVLFRGRHGIGKSEVVYALAENLGLQVVERRASQMTEGDLVGLPTLDGGTTTFNPPDWFAECCKNPRLLFLDEVDRATIEVRQGIFELTDSRKLNGHVLHEDTLIFACVNGGEHGAQYQVGEMDPAELDRWTCFDLEPTTEDWLAWAKDNVHTIVYDFIKAQPAHLEHGGEYEPNVVYPSRRSWKRCNDALVAADLLKKGADASVVFCLASGFVGSQAALDLQYYVQHYDHMFSAEDIVEKGKIKEAQRLEPAEHSSMIEKIKHVYFDGDLNDGQVANLAEYFSILPPEVAMSLFSEIGKTAAHGHTWFVRFYAHKLKNGKTPQSMILDITTGGKVKS
jgi:hypothetical protein